jgi:hypothetical protein
MDMCFKQTQFQNRVLASRVVSHGSAPNVILIIFMRARHVIRVIEETLTEIARRIVQFSTKIVPTANRNNVMNASADISNKTAHVWSPENVTTTTHSMRPPGTAKSARSRAVRHAFSNTDKIGSSTEPSGRSTPKSRSIVLCVHLRRHLPRTSLLAGTQTTSRIHSVILSVQTASTIS